MSVSLVKVKHFPSLRLKDPKKTKKKKNRSKALRTERERERERKGKKSVPSKFALLFVLLLASSSACTLDGMRYENWKRDLSLSLTRKRANITRRRRRTRTIKKNEEQRKETNAYRQNSDKTYRRAQGKLVLPDRVLRADFDLQQPLFP